jgi:alpha-glucoside transport system substrate-binding protein
MRCAAHRVVAMLLVGSSVASACGGIGSDSGSTGDLSVFGPWTDGDADAFAAALDGFDGGDVRYTGSGEFVGDLQQRIASGFDEPAVAMVPQPGLIAELAEAGDLVALSDDVVRVA